jgi:DUF4097 and DUF4098 domain-containing protein YvlB
MTSTQMPRLIMALLLVLLVGVTTSNLRSQEVRKEGRYSVGETVQTFSVGEHGTLRMIHIRGDVVIRGTDSKQGTIRQEIRLDVYTEEEARTAVQRVRTDYEIDDKVVTVRGSPESREWIQSSYTVEVPRAFDIEVQASDANLEVSGILGKLQLVTAGGNIVMKEIGGDVEALTSGGDIEARAIKGDLRVITSGGEILLEDLSGSVNAKTSGGDVTVRRAKKLVRLKSSGGDISVEDAGEVSARTSGGDMVIRRVKGSVSASTAGGDIVVRECEGPVEVGTAGGEIRVQDIGVGVVAKTAGGDIDLEGIRGYVEARTAGGNIEAEITLADFKRDHHVEMVTAGGDLILTLPEKIPATVQAEIRMERWGDFKIRSAFPLTITEEEGTGRRRGRRTLRAEGDLNGGGDLIRLETVNGDIVIRKR